MNCKPSIDILLATYNGQEYLAEQIDSILVQSSQDWQLLIRDDESSDNTLSIIRDYLSRYSSKIKLIEDNDRHIGAKFNFQRLLEHSTAEYIMFCDQDDVWLKQKIEVTLKAMRISEENYPNKPILVHSDLIVVDEHLKKIDDSLWSYQKNWPRKNDDLSRIIFQNIATGCTIMINRKAKNVSMPIPKDAIMHDWWIALKVAELGKIVHISDQLVLYRQHSGNLVGAKKAQTMNIWRFWGKLLSKAERKRILNYCRMLKIHNPNINPYLLMLKKVLYKLGQKWS
jgi:glycosyltransferase involved in cell wall biosynthesis